VSKGSPIRQVRVDKDRWKRIQAAAANEGARRGKPYTVSEWIRAAIDAYLGRKP
jgi:hypothetical protein